MRGLRGGAVAVACSREDARLPPASGGTFERSEASTDEVRIALPR
jgi:hypothetical protein